MKNLKITLILVAMVVACSFLSTDNFNDRKADDIHTMQMNGDIIDLNNDNMHDIECRCGYCEEGYNDSINEHVNQYLILNNNQ